MFSFKKKTVVKRGIWELEEVRTWGLGIWTDKKNEVTKVRFGHKKLTIYRYET